MNDLSDVFMLVGKQMIAPDGLLEFVKSELVGNKSLAMIEIDGDAINKEQRQIMETQMRNGRDDGNDRINLFANFMINNGSASLIQLGNEVMINFATAKHIVGIARHASSISSVFAHPLEIVGVVSASFKSSGVPRPKALALCAEHLVTAIGLVNENLAIWAWFGIGLQKSDGSDGIRVAHMVRIVAIGLEFPAMRASELVTGGTLPSGRDESVAARISTAMNELVVALALRVFLVLWLRSMSSQVIFGVHQIGLECGKALYFSSNGLDLIINVVDESVVSDGNLSSRKHGLFLGEENVLLVLGELAKKKRLGKSEVLKLRMSELSVAEHALGNSDVFATEESLVAGAAGSLGTGMKRAGDGFVVGGIEAVTAYNACGRHVYYNSYSEKEALIKERWRRKEINFFRILYM